MKRRKALRLPLAMVAAQVAALLIASSSYAQPGSTTTPSASSGVSPYAVISSSTAAWGLNDHGQLGNGTNTPANTPVGVSNLKGTEVKALAAGANHSLALKNDDTVWAWGNNGDGQLGNGDATHTNSNTPVQVKDATGFLTDVKAIAAGGDHSLALKHDGTVWAWGNNEDGELGTGLCSDCRDSNVADQVKSTDDDDFLRNVKAIAAGTFHSLALSTNPDGTTTVQAWGNNDYGQLGNGDATHTKRTFPGDVKTSSGDTLSGVKAIAGGGAHSLALQTDSAVQAWGRNEEGQLGNGTSGTGAHSDTPVGVLTQSGSPLKGIKAITAEGLTSLSIGPKGRVLAWGYGLDGELGNGFDNTISFPVYVKTSSGSRLSGIKAIAGGTAGAHCLALGSNGSVYAWGYNEFGQLGNGTGGTANNSNKAVKVSNLSGVSAIAAGAHHSLAN